MQLGDPFIGRLYGSKVTYKIRSWCRLSEEAERKTSAGIDHDTDEESSNKLEGWLASDLAELYDVKQLRKIDRRLDFIVGVRALGRAWELSE